MNTGAKSWRDSLWNEINFTIEMDHKKADN